MKSNDRRLRMLPRRAAACFLPALLLACSGEIGGGGSGLGTGEMVGPDGMPVSTSTGSTTTGSATSGAGAGATATGAAGGTTSPDVATALANAEPLPLALDGEPVFARTVRLTHHQWERSVQYLLQLAGPTGQESGLTDDAQAISDFSNNEEGLVVSGTLWNDYAQAARALASQVATDAAALSAIYPGTDAAGFIAEFGRRAFRRPLEAAEQAQYQAMFDTGVGLPGGGATEFARGAGLVIEAMLQSPNFLYRVELTAPGERLSGHELAAKLSLLLRGVTPDDALLDAAERGDLDTDAGVTSLVTQMLAESDLVEVMRQYHSELFKFNRYLTIQKDQTTVSEYTPALNEELQEASLLFFDKLVEDSLGVREMLLGNFAFVGPSMAEFYDVPARSGFQEITLGAERPGFFTQLPFLILNSVNLTPDPIHRGVALNLDVLCADIPPPQVAGLTLPGIQQGQTNRERVESASGAGTCGATCHAPYINPLGYAFENFDGLGRERDTDNGEPVDTTASYPFAEGNQSYAGAAQLMQIMAEGEQAHACYAKHLAGFVLQRDLTEADRSLIDSLTTASRAPSGSIKQMLLALVTDPTFTARAAGGTL